jgi:alpha-tubulin suppressor-like RCC1 family protein
MVRPHLGAASWRLQPARTRRVAILLVLVLIGSVSVAGLAVTRWAHAGTTSGDPYTWGSNNYGTLGVGDFNVASGPTPNHLSGVGAGIVSVVSGQAANDALAVGADGTLWGWGDNNEHEITPDAVQQYAAPVQVPNISSVTAAAAGNGFTLALRSDGTVWAWGTTQYGLGDGVNLSSATPVQVAFPSGVTIKAIAAGSIHSLAVDSTGNVWGWGYNGDGELGNNSTANSATPAQASMPPGVTFTEVAAGQSHSLALASDGTVYAWGADGSGQLGLGSSANATTPTPVSGMSGATAIAAGQSFSVVGTSSGAYTFGDDFEGELGNGTSGGMSPTPVQVSGLAGVNVTAVAAGDLHALALGADGTVYAWGYDNDGQLGPNGGSAGCGRFGDPCSTSAVAVTGVSGASGIASGTQFSLAVVPSAVPVASLNATSVSFGNQVQGTASATQSITVTNTGGGSLNIGSVSITGANASDFATSGCASQNLSAGASCTISVTFTPGAMGSRSATLSIGDNDAHSPQTVSLSGNGTYSWSGVQPSNGSTTFKAGSKIGLQFNLTGASAGIKTAVGSAFDAPVVNGTPGAYTPTVSAPPGSGNTFSYDKKSGMYLYTWSTKGLSAGTYSVKVTLDDGTTGTLTVTLQ